MSATEDWLGGLGQQDAARKSILLTEDPRDPEKVAESVRLARVVNLPPNVVEAAPDQFRTEEARKKATTALSGAPLTSRWLDDPTNAGLAKDDLENLTWFERSFGGVGRGAGRGMRLMTAIPPTFEALSSATKAGDVGRTYDDILAELAEPYGGMEALDRLPAPMRANLMQAAEERANRVAGFGDSDRERLIEQGAIAASTAQQIVDRVKTIPMSEAAAGFRDETLAVVEQGDLLGAVKAFVSDPRRAAAFIVETAAESLPILAAGTAATLVTRSPAVGAMALGATSFSTEATNSGLEFIEEQGVDISTPEAAAAALQDPELIRAASERGATRGVVIALFDAMSGGIAGQQLARSPAGDAIAQGLTQMVMGGSGEAAAQYASGQDFDARDVVAEALAEVVTAPIEVVGIGGRGVIREAGRYTRSGQTAERINEIDEVAAQSQLRERSPERFEAALREQGGEADAFFVPANGMREYFQAKDMALDDETLTAWGIEPSAFEEATASNGVVSVPASVYASRISGTEDAAWFAENATQSEDEMSIAEARRFNEEVEGILAQEAEQASEEEAARLEMRADDVQVREELHRQLRAAGRSPDVATQEAEVFTAFLRTMADRMGEPLLDLSRSMPVRIQGPFADEARRRGDIDRRLNALRRDPDRATAPRGPSLLDWVRDAGGISDQGGDIAAMDAPAGLIAETAEDVQARINQPTLGGMPAEGRGQSLDKLAEAAVAEGYFPGIGDGEDPAAVMLEAIREEIAGNPTFIPGQEPDPDMIALAEELSRRGIDSGMSNDEIVAALEAEDGAREFNQDHLIAPVPISTAPDRDNPQGAARQVYEDTLKGTEAVTADGTSVRFTGRGKGKAFTRGTDPARRAALAPHLREIVESARVYDREADRQGRPGMEYVYAASAVEIEGETFAVKLILRRASDQTAFYELQGYELAPSDRTSGGALTDGDPLADPAYAPEGNTLKMSDLVAAFKGPVRFQDRRGSIQVPKGGLREGETVINLFEGADLSTFIHESGHYFLEAFTLLADSPEGSERMRSDLDTIREWVGAKEGEAFTTEHHEKWARGFEAYALEGKAPSLALADAFARFKSWLTRIYRTVRGLDVQITPEIREVMDRMLATDAEIAAARDVAAMDPLFKEGPPPGMSETDYRTYARAARRSEESARQALLERTMAKVRREREAWYKAEKKALWEDVENQINRQPVYRLTEMLANQRWIGNEGADLLDMRIDRKALVDQFGEGVIPELSRQSIGGKRAIYTSEGGSSPREVAEFFGFDSATQMVEALQNAGKRRQAIAAEVDRRMQERHGDPLNDGTIEEEALRVIHNGEQVQASVREVRYLAEQIGRPTRNMQPRIYRQRARQMLQRMQVAQAIKPRQFLQAERKAARAAQDAFARSTRSGGREALAAALQAKEQQILNGYLYDEALKIEQAIEKKREHMRDLDKRKTREKIGQLYVQQIDAILDHYDFRRRTGKAVARSENLRAFMERMREEGRETDLNIDPRLVDDAQRRHYSRLTVSELQGVFDTIDNLEHLGRFKEKLIEKNRRRDEAESARAIIGQVEANAKPVDPKKRQIGRSYLNLFRSPDTIMIALDGGDEFGRVYEELKRGVDDGAALEQQMAAEAGKRLDAAFSDHYDRSEMKALMEPMDLRGLQVRRDWTKAEVLALALNSGNADNFQRLVDESVTAEYRLTRDEIQDILSRLDERDWRFVQRMWDEVNRLWPDLAAVHRRRSGVEPKKVEANLMVDAPSFVTGGYYPLKYDPSVSVKAERDERSAFDDAQSLGWGAAAAVGAGMTKDRAKNAQGRPVLLDLSVAHRHIRETARYIALSEPVDNAWRLLNREDVGEAMKAHGHDDTLDTLRLWLQDTAMGPVFNKKIWDASARALKNNFTMSKLAFNMKTVALQVTGLGQAAAVVGKKNLGQALVTYGKAPRELSAEVVAKSPFMAERETTFQKDVFDMLNEGDVSTPLRSDYFKLRDMTMRAGMWAIQKTQFYTVDMPTWLAGYRAAIQWGADEATAISRADRLVARSQSSGLLSDRSGIERGTTSAKTRQSDFVKLFTTLGSYMIAKNNRAQVTLMQASKGVKESETALQAVAPVLNAAVDLTLLFAFEAVVMGIGYSMLTDEEEEDEVLKFVVKEAAFSPLAGMPFLRDAKGVLEGFGAGGAYASIGETIFQPVNQFKQGELDRAAMRAYADAFGLATGFPSTAAFRIGDSVAGEGTPAELLFGTNPLTR